MRGNFPRPVGRLVDDGDASGLGCLQVDRVDADPGPPDDPDAGRQRLDVVFPKWLQRYDYARRARRQFRQLAGV